MSLKTRGDARTTATAPRPKGLHGVAGVQAPERWTLIGLTGSCPLTWCDADGLTRGLLCGLPTVTAAVIRCSLVRGRWDVAGITIARDEHDAASLRRAASRSRDADAARRMLAPALMLEGASRADAARAAGMDRQTLRDWVHRYNAEGLAGLSARPHGAGWHQPGGKLRIPDNISLPPLPPYSPELNPVENVWQCR